MEASELPQEKYIEIVATLTMLAGFLIQNYAEWRGGGPSPPDLKIRGVSLRPRTDSSRAFALVLVSLIVVALSVTSMASGIGWIAVGIAASLIANAVVQSIVSLRAARLQPGTMTGLLVMLPSSLWVVLVVDTRFGWLPILLGPLASVPLLVAVWWLSNVLTKRRPTR